MKRSHLTWLVIVLCATGFGLFAYKVFVLQFPLRSDTTSPFWTVEVKIEFEARGKPAKVSLFLPQDAPHAIVNDESFVSFRYGLTTSTSRLNRKAIWSIRKATGRQVLYYRVVIRKAESTIPEGDREELQKLPTVEFSEVLEGAALSLIEQLREQSADIDSFVLNLLRRLKASSPDETIKILLGGETSLGAKLSLARRILVSAKIPAHVVNGIILAGQGGRAPFVEWLEVYDVEEKVWKQYNVSVLEVGIPENYFAWWKGSRHVVSGKGVEHVEAHFSVSKTEEKAILSALTKGEKHLPLLLDFSLFSLPLETQAVYRVLLIIPLGVVIIILLRNVVGLKTFGTFMPVLIGLSFRETELLAGISLFIVIISLGLAVRFYLEQLHLLLVPRLGAVLIVVVILMAFLSVVLHQLGLERGLSIALFPMVILAMTIERMSVVWEEQGAFEAIKQGCGSLVAASLSYFVMINKSLEHLLFVFPELLLLLLAVAILLGRYTGYRLSELNRFRDLIKVS